MCGGLELVQVGRYIIQGGVLPATVVEADDVVGDVDDRPAVIGVIPTSPRFQ
jgi:hypothetical protein